jgi:hypothetical protein
MPPVTKLPSVSELTKEMIGDLYFRSLSNFEARKNHVSLAPKLIEGASPPSSTTTAVSPHEIEQDFTAWYGGVISLAHAMDPGVELPRTKEMIALITPQSDRAKKAMAA